MAAIERNEDIEAWSQRSVSGWCSANAAALEKLRLTSN
jgi:hypothetical protein